MGLRDKRSGLEAIALKQAMRSCQTRLRWCLFVRLFPEVLGPVENIDDFLGYRHAGLQNELQTTPTE